jgi:hypothetical protein
VVVDHEHGAGVRRDLAQAPRERKQVTPAKLLLAKLKDFGPAP